MDMEFKEEEDELIKDGRESSVGGLPLPVELLYRELGFNSHFPKRRKCVIGKKLVSDNFAATADFNLVACNKKLLTKSKFKLPSGARTTFHMAFSGDGKLVASCHGDHNVYVCEIKSGKVVKTLSGHPRTPWTVTFHPTQSDILASGCLAGHVRVWDLKGGSELLITDSGTVIASLAFHPTVRLLAIGTFNEVLFWDWSRGDVPLARCCTENNKEKVRLVRFDSTGRSLITGITNFPTAPSAGGGLLNPTINRPSINILRGLGELDLDPDIQEELEERQDRFQESYRQLVTHYEDLVQHYHTFLRSRIPRILGTNNNNNNGGGLGLGGGLAEELRNITAVGVIVGGGGGTSTTMSHPYNSEGHTASRGGDEPRPGPSSRLLTPHDTDTTTTTTATHHLQFPQPLNNNNNQIPPLLRPNSNNNPLLSQQASLVHRLFGVPLPHAGDSPTTSQQQQPTLNNATLASPPSSSSSTPPSSSSQAAAGSSSSATAREFGSIEALAQNIMEMQNLCSQARQRVRLGPPTMETQHVMELQQIRQHLEVLQDQTRRLQHSIRATLSSLATGSLAALRTQQEQHQSNNNSSTTSTTNTASTSANNPLHYNSSTVPTPSNNNPSPISSSMVNSSTPPPPLLPPSLSNLLSFQTNTSNNNNNGNSASSSSSSAAAIEEQRPRRSISPSTSSSTSFFRISINSNPDRMRVPPVVRYNDNRRVVTREFVIDHHSRNCPFNLNQQPTPIGNRTRCLIEDDGQIELEPWPNYDTGMATSTRSFPGVEIERIAEANNSSNNNNSPSAEMNLRVFLSVRGTDDVEMSENWQRNFLSGLALVPSAVREGRRGRNIRIRRNYPHRSQVPNRLNNSFVRSFYIRVDTELVPVYSSHETSSGHEIRDSLGSNVFVFPITVFFNDFDSNQQLGIYWPCMSQGEEEALSDVRRYEQPITVYPNQNAGGRRVRVSYDANSLDIEVSGVRLGTVQPGVQVLEGVTNLRGGGTRGVIYVDYLAPLLEGMERYFSQQFLGTTARSRRRQPRRIITFARDGQPGGYEYRSGSGSSRVSQFHDGPSDEDNRRVLSLAVETQLASTASELLINRRPVESRIERVLNSSTALNSLAAANAAGSSSSSSGPIPGPSSSLHHLHHSRESGGMSSGGSSSFNSSGSSSSSGSNTPTNQERLDDIQRRISVLTNSNWSRGGRASSTTQTPTNSAAAGGGGSSLPPGSDEGLIINRSQQIGPTNSGIPLPQQHHHWVIRRQRRFTNQPIQRGGSTSIVDSGSSARTRASNQAGRAPNNDQEEEASRFFQAYNPEILITPRATLNGSGGGSHNVHHQPPIAPPPSSSYYHLDAATTSFLSSRVQRWDFSQFVVPDISKRHINIVVRECSLHSDACLDVSKNSEFLAVLQPSDSGAYSSLGVYSLKSESLGDLMYVYHFDQNTVSISISPSSEFICVGYAGRGPMYRFVQQGNSTGRNIGQILSMRGKNGTLSPVRDLYAENTSVVAINCMHFLPVPGQGILYGTNVGELVLIN